MISAMLGHRVGHSAPARARGSSGARTRRRLSVRLSTRAQLSSRDDDELRHRWPDVLPIPTRLPLQRYASSLARRLAPDEDDAGDGRPRKRVLLVAAGNAAAAQAVGVVAEAVRRGERSLGFSALVSVAISQEDAVGGATARGELRDERVSSAAEAGGGGGGDQPSLAVLQRGAPMPALARRRKKGGYYEDDYDAAYRDEENEVEEVDDEEEDERGGGGGGEDGEDGEDSEGDGDDDAEELSYGWGRLIERRQKRAVAVSAWRRTGDGRYLFPPIKVQQRGAAKAAPGGARRQQGAEEAPHRPRVPSQDDVFCFYTWGIDCRSLSGAGGGGGGDDDGEEEEEEEEEVLEEQGEGGALVASARTAPIFLARRITAGVRGEAGSCVIEAAMGPAAVVVVRAIALASEWRRGRGRGRGGRGRGGGDGGGGGGLAFHAAKFSAPDRRAAEGSVQPGRPPPHVRLVRFTIVPVPEAWWEGV